MSKGDERRGPRPRFDAGEVHVRLNEDLLRRLEAAAGTAVPPQSLSDVVRGLIAQHLPVQPPGA